jgi:hypothetical protein
MIGMSVSGDEIVSRDYIVATEGSRTSKSTQ